MKFVYQFKQFLGHTNVVEIKLHIDWFFFKFFLNGYLHLIFNFFFLIIYQNFPLFNKYLFCFIFNNVFQKTFVLNWIFHILLPTYAHVCVCFFFFRVGFFSYYDRFSYYIFKLFFLLLFIFHFQIYFFHSLIFIFFFYWYLIFL